MSLAYLCLILSCKINGVNFTSNTYEHRSVVSEMTEALAQAVGEELINELRASSFFGLICDESSDVSNFKKLIVYITYVTDHGIGKTAFLDVLDIEDGKADTIVNSIKGTLEKVDIDLSNIVGLGTDGAAVMTGCKGGVGVRLKDTGASSLIQIHCSAHRVSLALSQAAKNIPQINNLEVTLSQLFHFFDDSPVRESVLRQINEINDMPEVKLKEPKNVRWLSLYEAVNAVMKSYESIVQALEHIAEKKNDINSVKAKGLLTKIKVSSFPYLLSVVSDVLEPVKKLSLIFQKQNVMFSKINAMVYSCIGVLESLKESVGENEKKYRESCNKSDNNSELIKPQFITEVIQNLKYRFPEETLGLLQALDAIFNPLNYPTNSDGLKSYGEKDLEHLISHYRCLISEDILKKDFMYFKHIALNFKALNMSDFIGKLIFQYKDELPEFVKLAKIIIVLPVSSADAERGFSAMKRIKTSARNRMSEEKLKKLIMISVQGPELSQSQPIIKRATEIFNSTKTRRGGLSKQ